ncbi:DUF4157 domain-containing protein [Aequorivita sp. F47161]|uniref:DUF4157 domain-containing protein n=1 Tax=Aequorivita vitellina TaxID=2874475 RepID=A0A9X1U2L2_9FLAO|nr:DUF4157 domain-containing protein [Aequorivita vitellina]MCG2418337.1 DUF4157 domain-containing protein [Aequorivita vitellina]
MFKTTKNAKYAKKTGNSNLQQNAGKNAAFFIQAKLSVGKSDDQFEREADSVADRVVNNSQENLRKSDTFFPAKPVQRKAIDEKKEALQMKNSKPQKTAPINMEQNIAHSEGGGNPINEPVKKRMETSFGADFSDVKIHTGNNATAMNKALGAQAFTTDNHIFFNSGKYNPSTKKGQHLLAHELTHTLQQRKSNFKRIQKKDLVSPRFGGDALLEEVLDGNELVSTTNNSKGAHVRIIQQALTDAGFILKKYGVDGDFGGETKDQVIAFQKAQKLPKKEQDGIVGPITMNELDQKFIGHKTEHSNFSGIDQPTLDTKTRAITTDEKAAVKEALSTEVKKDPKTGKDPIFDKTKMAAYKKDLKALTEKYVINQYNHLGKGKKALRSKKGNLHDKKDVEALAKVSKIETDKVYGNLKKGKDFVFGTNLFDGWEEKKAKLKGKSKKEQDATKKAWANWRVQKIIQSNRVEPINKKYNAIQNREPEATVVKEIIKELSAAYRKELVLTHLGWPGYADDGKVFLQRYKSSNNDKNRKYMWSNFATIIHEYIHTLEHKDAITYRESLNDKEGGKVLREGMPEYFSKIVWNNLNLTDHTLRKSVEGPFYDATKSDIYKNHYYSEGKNAEKIAGIVGTSNVMGYFFLGKVKLIQ